VSAAELGNELGISQATLSRLLRELGMSVLVCGRGRSTRYLLRRAVAELPLATTIYAIAEDGRSSVLGSLHPVGAGGFYIETESEWLSSRYYPDWPWFLDGLRPTGFLGRLIPSRHPELGLPPDVRNWGGDHVLRYLARGGFDGPGDLLLGDAALQHHLNGRGTARTTIDPQGRVASYEERAITGLKYGTPGSSAAGEQPKFLAGVGAPPREVLVKFSPPLDGPVARRLADLLICEHLSQGSLEQLGLPAAKSELIEGERRLFLEVQRFDRTALGRRGVVALDALDHEFVGLGGHGQWEPICRSLVEQGLLGAGELSRVRKAVLFGQLIANSDMHPGNLAFFCRGQRVGELAPIYDMLPMAYAPLQGHLVERDYTPVLPSSASGEVFSQVCSVAIAYWEQVANHALISVPFAELAGRNAELLRVLQSRAHLLPAR
jgi:hypothetical protein